MSRLELLKEVEGWDWTPITEVAGTITDFVSNGSFASLRENVTYKRDPDHAILLRIADYSKDFAGPFVYVDEEAYKFLNKSSLHPGDIVVGNVGSIGTAFETPVLGQPLTIGPNALLVRPKLPNRFLYFMIQSPLFQEHLQRISSKIAQPKFNKTQFRSIEIPMPPAAEQGRIAQVLGTVQQAIEQQERLIRSTTELKQALMRKLLTRSDGEAWTDEETVSEPDEIRCGTLPKGWRFVPLGSFCDFKGGTQPPKSNFIYEPRAGYVRLLQIRDFESDSRACYIPETSRLTRLSETDVSIARYGASVGRILTGKAGVINVAIMTTLPDEAQVNKRYLYYLIQLDDFFRYISTLGGRAAQAGFNRGEINRFRFPLPPMTEQRQIVDALDTLGKKHDHHSAKMETLHDLFRTLLHELMTGKVRVNKLEHEQN